MTATTSAERRGLEIIKNAQFRTGRFLTASALTKDKLVEFTSGNVQLAGYDSLAIAGAVRNAYSSGAYADVLAGLCVLTAGGPITAGQKIKAGISGVAFPLLTAGNASTTLDTSSAGIGYTLAGQPQNDGVEIVSSSAGDTTQTATLYGTTTSTDTVVTEAVALTGTSVASSVKVDWGFILGISLDAACAGTVTFREASGNTAFTTITAGNLTSGLDAVTTDSGWTLNNIPQLVGSGATTKVVGVIGQNSSGTTIYDSKALNGTTAVALNSAFYKVTYFLTGDLEATRTASLKLGSTAESANRCVGRALTTAAASGDTFLAWVMP